MRREVSMVLKADGKEYLMRLRNTFNFVGKDSSDEEKEFVKYVRLHETFGWYSGVDVDSDMHIIFIKDKMKDSIEILRNMKDAIVFIDIDCDDKWLSSRDFIKLADKGENAFILVSDGYAVRNCNRNRVSTCMKVVKQDVKNA